MYLAWDPYIVALGVRGTLPVYNSGVRATFLLLLFAVASLAQSSRVVLETQFGSIEVQLDLKHAPQSSANFLRYVDEGSYNGGSFHRTVRMDNQPSNRIRIEVVQAGARPAGRTPEVPPIPLERTSRTGLRHLDGTVSMARDRPDSATSEFFICIGDQPALDYGGMRNPDGQGFAAFGRVVSGMEVVRRIQQSPAEGQTLKPPIRILRARRVGP